MEQSPFPILEKQDNEDCKTIYLDNENYLREIKTK